MLPLVGYECAPDDIVCYRHCKMVYIPVLKCASMLFQKLVIDNKWEQIKAGSINWHRDHVFGFISNPVERYIKGLAEDSYEISIEKTLEFLEYQKKNLVLISHHSVPITCYIGPMCWQVDWIPLDSQNYQRALDHFKKLCLSYNYDPVIDPKLDMHQSNFEKKKISTMIQKHVSDGSHVLWKLLHEDIRLMEIVTEYFKDDQTSWHDTSWLQNYKRQNK